MAAQREGLISYDPLTQPTLGQVVERVEAIVAAGIPLDTPLTKWHNPDRLRDELVFEVFPPLADLTADELIAEAEANPADAHRYQAEIMRRLREAEQAAAEPAKPVDTPVADTVKGSRA